MHRRVTALSFLLFATLIFPVVVQAQNISTLVGLWTFERNGSEGILFRDNGTGRYIGDHPVDFTYELRDTLLVLTSTDTDAATAWEIRDVTGQLLVMSPNATDMSVTLIKHGANLDPVPINLSLLSGEWHVYSNDFFGGMTFRDNGTYSYFQSPFQSPLKGDGIYLPDGDGSFEVSNGRIVLTPNSGSATTLVGLLFENSVVVLEFQDRLVSFTRSAKPKQDASNIVGIWLQTASFWPSGPSNVFLEFRNDGTAMSTAPYVTGTYQLTGQSLTITGTNTETVRFDIDRLDKNLLAMSDARSDGSVSFNKIYVKIAAPPSSTTPASLFGTWKADARTIEFFEDNTCRRSTRMGNGTEKSYNCKYERDENTLIFLGAQDMVCDVLRLDNLFLVFLCLGDEAPSVFKRSGT